MTAVNLRVEPIQIDCKDLRVERQKENNNTMLQLLQSGNMTLVKRFCNIKELDRLLKDLEIDEQKLINKCANDLLFAKSVARQISKMASRQGTKDEAFILQKCNETISQFGVYIENLSTVAYRPTKDGRILTNKEYRNSSLKKNDCLKSFDAEISGLVQGWVFAKIVYGKGGHQDNVFAEAHHFAEWVKEHGKETELYVILIDTDLTRQFEELKTKCDDTKNILVCNHVELQRYLLNTGLKIKNQK